MENYISPYAAAHPWEDWAETWAHYLHMMDTLETAASFDVHIAMIGTDPSTNGTVAIAKQPYDSEVFD